MITLKDKPDFTELQGDKYDYCTMCGPEELRAVVYFDSGSVEPTEDETITGATSGHTGVIEFYQLADGSYAGGDATGIIIVTSPTGYDADDLLIFEDNEELNGSTAGDSFSTVKGICGINKNGRVYPQSELIEYQGQKYCKEHFAFRFRREWLDEQDIDLNENERGRV